MRRAPSVKRLIDALQQVSPDVARTIRIGAWLENPLTADGVAYVREAIQDNPRGAVTRLWRRWYAEELAS